MSLFNHSNCSSCEHSKMGDTALNGLIEFLDQIINAVKNSNTANFNVNVDIKLKNGVIHTVNFSKSSINNIILDKTTLITNDLAISLCDFAKININSSDVSDQNFANNILNYFTKHCPKKDKHKCCGCNSSWGQDWDYSSDFENHHASTEESCTNDMQDYINENRNKIGSIAYNGGLSQIETISSLDSITNANVVESATLNTTTTPALNNATLNATTTPVVNAITPADATVVSSVTLSDDTLVSGITKQTVSVSAPITATPTSVVSEVTTTTDTVVTGITPETETVVNSVTSTTDTAVTGFGTGRTIDGVISNVDTISNITPIAVDVPKITSNATGTLQITIPVGGIDGTIPATELTFNVTVGGENISFDGNTQRFILPSATNVLGGATTTPELETITEQGTPTTDTFTKTVTSTTATVLSGVTPTTSTGGLVDTVTNIDVNNIDTPTNVTVLEDVTEASSTVRGVTAVTEIPASDLFTSTTENVLSSADLTTTSENVINSISLATSNIPVINSIDASEQSIYSPVQETITGQIISVCDGIMVVSNPNGDIIAYSIRDINSVQSS